MNVLSRLCAVILAVSFGLVAMGKAHATYPDKPIRLVAPYAAGGLTDILARSLAQELSNRVGQPVIVENRAGAGGIIGTDFVAKAPPDGYTLALLSQGLASVNASLYPNLPYDTQRDFTPISLIAKFSMVLVGNPARTSESANQLIDQARKNPLALTYGSAGNASTAHLTMVMLNDATGTKMLHVPFKGEAPALTELVGGRIDSIFATVGGALPLIQGGKLRAIAVADKTRNSQLPDVPTLRETGVKDFEVFGWYAVLAPAKVPPEVVTRLSKALMAIGKDAQFQKSMIARGIEAVGSTPDEAAKTIRDETARWGAIVRKANITVD
ncbi:tripartite tricarboxylate transporter substrate binding protein [Variovorax sp. Sphag1AA]|uniref:Bug family tripartite tricarboxylate transporter substrate binding protein n=1 Tax=Variovorax sp. Sphag1AA TaxID=2587027 RepID=UPI001610EAD9|nr:tripartite tricarboxylate transporter substrate binding protein [Variovorax sp. Sphag1AA]MBB3181129.1 tripartite-type tricarboxylate transporter receptor subunit TctC [Variovorax sp. Sphag1AA]